MIVRHFGKHRLSQRAAEEIKRHLEPGLRFAQVFADCVKVDTADGRIVGSRMTLVASTEESQE